MNTLKQEIVDQFVAIMNEETSLVVAATNGSNNCNGIRTSRTRDGFIVETNGRNDPERFAVRFVIDQIGSVRPGQTITVAGDAVNVEDANPDAVGAIVEVLCLKRRVKQ